MTDATVKTYTAELTGADIRQAFCAIFDNVERLEARAEQYRRRTTTHARNSLRDVNYQIAAARLALDTFQKLYYVQHDDMLVALKSDAGLDTEVAR